MLWLYRLSKRKSFQIIAGLLIVVALAIAFGNTFGWLQFGWPVRLLMAFLVVGTWLALNAPPPRLAVGSFVIAFAELGEEKNEDGGYYGEIRAQPRRPNLLMAVRGGDSYYIDDSTDKDNEKGASKTARNFYLSRRARPVASLQGANENRRLPAAPGDNSTTALAPSRRIGEAGLSDQYYGLNGNSNGNGRRNGARRNDFGEVLTTTRNVSSQPVTLARPVEKWRDVVGSRAITDYLQQRSQQQLVVEDIQGAAIYPVGFVDDAAGAIQLAQEARAQVVIWGWNSYRTRRDFVPRFEVLTPLEDSMPSVSDMQVLGLKSFELGQLNIKYSSIFTAFVAGLGAYGVAASPTARAENPDIMKQARSELGLALTSSYMHGANARYNSGVDRSIIYFYLGNVCLFDHDYNKAIACYREALAIDPDFIQARHNMGIVMLLQGQVNQAIKWFIKVIQQKPNLAAARYNLAMAYLEREQYPQARREFSSAIEANAKFAAAYRGIGLTYQREQLLSARNSNASDEAESNRDRLRKQAINWLREALKVRPDFARVHVDIAEIIAEPAIRELNRARSSQLIFEQTRNPQALHIAEESRHLAYTGLDEAIAELRDALTIDPQLALAHYRLGVLLAAREEIDAAAEALREAVRLQPDFGDAHFALGDIYKQRGQEELANKQFELGARARQLSSPVSAQDYINRGIGLLESQQLQPAREAFEKALQMEPNNVEAMMRLGMVYQELGSFDRAYQYYTAAMRLEGAPDDIYNKLASLYRQEGDEDSATRVIQQAAAAKPSSSKLQYYLGNTYRRLKDDGAAMSSYIQAIRIDPNNADARFNLAMIYFGRKQFMDAELQFSEVTRIRPDDFQAHSFLGRIYLQQGQTERAISALEDAIRVQPDAIEALLTLGEIYLRDLKPELAIEQFNAVLRKQPDNLRAREMLGRGYAAASKLDLAIETFQAILQITPDSTAAHYNLGVAFIAQEHYEEAAEQFDAFVQAKPDDADGFFNLGLSLHRQYLAYKLYLERFENGRKADDAELQPELRAISCFSRAIELRPSFADAYNYLGQALMEIGQTAEAVKAFQSYSTYKQRG